MKKGIIFTMALCIFLGCMGSAFAASKYESEIQLDQFRAHGGDKGEITEMMKELVSNLNDPMKLKNYIAPGAESEEILAYFNELKQYKNINFSTLYFEKFYQVKGYDIYHSFRGIVSFKFVGTDAKGRLIERTDLLAVAKLGEQATDWKIWKVLWKDTGIDVSDAVLFQLEMPKKGEEICVMTTEAGVIKMRLFPEQAPLAVQNFKGLAKANFYDNTIFSRVINDFVIQAGALDGSGKEEESYFGGFFKDEFSRNLFNFNGALCMGNAGPNTNGNQFYIVQTHNVKDEHLDLSALPLNAEAKYREIGGLPYLDKRYTVFGQVFEGMDVVDKIAAQKTDDAGMPVKDPIKILDVQFVKYK